MTDLNLSIQGMSCGGCSNTLTSLLEKNPGISNINISHQANNGAMTIDETMVSQKQIEEIIEKAGFDVV